MEILDYNTLEALNKEWTAFLRPISWDGCGSTIEESNRVFIKKRTKWMKRMCKKHNVTMTQLEVHYVH